MTDPEPVQFAADFPAATREQWRQLVDAVLKGAPFERLVSTTYDGLAIEPLAARRSDARPVSARPGATTWEILARIDHPDPALANEIALRELGNGATGLALVFKGSRGDYGFGLPATETALVRALEGVHLDAGISVEVDLSPAAVAVIDALLARGLVFPAPAANIRLGHDPLGANALTGSAVRAWTEQAPHFARRLAALSRAGFGGKLAAADGRVIHNAGGSEAQELAFALSVALAYLRALEAEGVALDAARRMIFFRLSADADQLLTIAKFRALRKLWARVEASCGLAAEPSFHLCRNRMAHDGAPRSAREHSARDDCSVCRRAGRRRRDHRLAVHRRARPARPVRAPDRAQYSAPPQRRIASRQSRRSGGGLRRR